MHDTIEFSQNKLFVTSKKEIENKYAIQMQTVYYNIQCIAKFVIICHI